MTTVIMIVLLVGLFYLMYRSNKKQEREAAQMRNSLEVGDEITTIGGIIGEIVKIKEETVTIETGKDRTKIRILRSAVRTVDVHAYEKRGDGKKPEPVDTTMPNTAKPNTAPVKKNKTAQIKKLDPKASTSDIKADGKATESETPKADSQVNAKDDKEFNYEYVTSEVSDKAE